MISTVLVLVLLTALVATETDHDRESN